MTNWKTTLGGIIVALAALITTTVQQGHTLADWKTWILPVALAVFGLISKDFNVTGGTAVKLLLASVCLLSFTSCAGMMSNVVSDTTTTSPDGTITKTHTTATNSDAALAAGAQLGAAALNIAGPAIIHATK
jgi:hypothetical protein